MTLPSSFNCMGFRWCSSSNSDRWRQALIFTQGFAGRYFSGIVVIVHGALGGKSSNQGQIKLLSYCFNAADNSTCLFHCIIFMALQTVAELSWRVNSNCLGSIFMFSQRAKTSKFKQRQKLKASIPSDVHIPISKIEYVAALYNLELYRTQKIKI